MNEEEQEVIEAGTGDRRVAIRVVEDRVGPPTEETATPEVMAQYPHLQALHNAIEAERERLENNIGHLGIEPSDVRDIEALGYADVPEESPETPTEAEVTPHPVNEAPAEEEPENEAEDSGEAIINEAVEKVVEESENRTKSFKDVSKDIHLEIMEAIKSSNIGSYEDGYYNKPALKIKYGVVVPGGYSVPNNNALVMKSEWTKVFLRFFYSRNYNMSFLQALSDPECFDKCQKDINDSIKNSSFFEEDDPFSIKLPFISRNISETSSFFLILDNEYIGHPAFEPGAFQAACELSKRQMESEVDLFYYTEMLPQVTFSFEEIEIPENNRIKNSLRKNLKVRKLTAATGAEFYTITGPKRKVAEVAVAFKDVLSDNSIKFQKTYRNIAKEFLANNWWHPKMKMVTDEELPNPEKIFTPNLSKSVTGENYEKAMKEIYRIRNELIPEGSVLAMVSPFVFERPVKEYNEERPTPINAPIPLPARDENDMTYLPDFMTEKFLVPNMSLSSMNSTLVESHGLRDQDVSDVLSCGLLTDDKLNSPRKILELPELPENSTIILKSLEFR